MIISRTPFRVSFFGGLWGSNVYKSDREQALAKAAVAQMGECDVIPTRQFGHVPSQ